MGKMIGACALCNGIGESDMCFGTGKAECDECFGSGDCFFCDGQGEELVYDFDDSRWVNCSCCYGGKKCQRYGSL